MIPKILHFIWVGDESKRPNNCISTWVAHHPEWQIRVWGNADLDGHSWINQRHIDEMYHKELNGVADLMRWEILSFYGGIVVDADSVCLRPLDDEILDCEAFACWESEIARPGLIAAGYVGCTQGNEFVTQIIVDIAQESSIINQPAWQTVGPLRLTDSYRKYQYFPLRIYPSHYFIPRHHTGLKYNGAGPVYADQLWGSTHSSYDKIHQLDFSSIAIPPGKVLGGHPRLAADQAGPSTMHKKQSIETRHSPYFVQRVEVSAALKGLGRLDVFKHFCQGKRVLHIGCADWPITDVANSLHLALEPHCAVLDGFDIHQEALDMLVPYTKGQLYSRFEDLTANYDLVLVPEVLEHISDTATFLGQLESLNAPHFLISVPDAYQCRERHFDYVAETQTFVEIVHPDHNVWYTPYTLFNTIKKYCQMNTEKMWFFNEISILALLAKQPQPVI